MRALLLEDHQATRVAICTAMSRLGVQLHGAADIREALVVVKAEELQLALVDLNLGEESGRDAIAVLNELGVTCLALTNADDAQSVIETIRAGAAGYLLKTDPPAMVVAALHQADAGQRPLSAGVTHHLIDVVAPANGEGPPYALTVHLADGHAEISDAATAQRCALTSDAKVSMMYALGERWTLDGPGRGRGWLDDESLALAIWGRRHRGFLRNNINVLIHRVRTSVAANGLDPAFIEKVRGRTRIQVAAVHLLA